MSICKIVQQKAIDQRHASVDKNELNDVYGLAGLVNKIDHLM